MSQEQIIEDVGDIKEEVEEVIEAIEDAIKDVKELGDARIDDVIEINWTKELKVEESGDSRYSEDREDSKNSGDDSEDDDKDDLIKINQKLDQIIQELEVINRNQTHSVKKYGSYNKSFKLYLDYHQFGLFMNFFAIIGVVCFVKILSGVLGYFVKI